MKRFDRNKKQTPEERRAAYERLTSGVIFERIEKEESAANPESDNPDHPDHPDHSHLDETEARVKALESLLVQKGYIDPEALDEIIETYETKIGPHNGAQVIARAWLEADFHRLLLEDATQAVHSMGFTGRQGEHLTAFANSEDEHHLVVCTLCSCYPWAVLGLPPRWYKSPAYRAKAVIDPRGVLADFGLTLPKRKKISVHDSTSEMRYLVVPERPENTENWTEDQLARLVTRDSMIGTGLALNPDEFDPDELPDELEGEKK